jgi:hypothetical protein
MKLGSLAVAAAAVLAAGSASAGTVVTGLHDTLTASPQHYVGRCPGVITFQGTIVVRGDFQRGQPAEIGYQFTRSDGAMSQNKYISVPGPGVYHITETWTLGGAQLPHFQGWEKFKAWPTANVQNHTGDTWSNEAHFSLVCARVR